MQTIIDPENVEQMNKALETSQKEIIRLLSTVPLRRSSNDNKKLCNFFADCKVFQPCSGNFEQMLEIISKGQLVRYNEKEYIYSKGDQSDYFYIVVYGIISVYQIVYNEITEEEYRLPITDLHQLDYFGNIEIIYDTKRMQTILSVNQSYLLRFSKTFYQIKLQNFGFSEIEKCIEFLHSAPYLNELEMQEVIVLAMKSQIVNFHSKQIALEAKTRSKYIYFILNGRFQVIQKLTNGKHVQIDVLEKGDFFGHMHMLNPNENIQGCYVYSMLPSSCMKIYETDFLQLPKRVLAKVREYLPPYPEESGLLKMFKDNLIEDIHSKAIVDSHISKVDTQTQFQKTFSTFLRDKIDTTQNQILQINYIQYPQKPLGERFQEALQKKYAPKIQDQYQIKSGKKLPDDYLRKVLAGETQKRKMIVKKQSRNILYKQYSTAQILQNVEKASGQFYSLKNNKEWMQTMRVDQKWSNTSHNNNNGARELSHRSLPRISLHQTLSDQFNVVQFPNNLNVSKPIGYNEANTLITPNHLKNLNAHSMMPGAHRDLNMWKPLMAEEMIKSFDLRQRQSGAKVENYKWMPGKYGYNRSEVVSNLGNLKSQYDIAGGQVNPDFYKQVSDLENYIMHNKRAPVLERSYRSNNVVHHVNGGQYYPGASFVVHQNPVMAEERIIVNEFDIEWFIKQALRWDDIFVGSYNQIEDVKERIIKFLSNFNGIHDYDVYRGRGMTYFPWEDYEIWRVLENCRVNEEEMLLHLSRIPDDLLMYQVRWLKYQELMRIRIEIERWLYFLANEFKKPYNPPVILEEPKKPGLKYAGEFVVFWDYILDIFKKVRDVQIVYGVYNKGATILKPRLVDNKPVENTQKTRFQGQAMFDISHLIKDVKAENESFLIFEVQGNPIGDKFNLKSLGIDEGNGYPLREDGDKDGWDLFKSFEEAEQGMRTLGWSFIDLFDLKQQLKTGPWKVPLYLPPTMINIDIKTFQQQAIRIPKTMVHLRIDYPDIPDIVNIDGCHLTYQHLYRIPDYHNFICRYAVSTPGRDPDYKCPGLKVYVHSGIGFFPERKVRVAWCVQLGKHVLSEKEGVLCFYATSGLNPNTKKAIQEGALPTDIISFNDGKDWYKDFYDLLWTLWERKLESELYLIVQYLQLKDNTQPSAASVISRVLLEEEYDLLGYGVIKINDKDGKMRFGDYRLDLHEGPIYVEDVDKHPKNGRYIWVSITQPGANVVPKTPPQPNVHPQVVQKFQKKFETKNKTAVANMAKSMAQAIQQAKNQTPATQQLMQLQLGQTNPSNPLNENVVQAMQNTLKTPAGPVKQTPSTQQMNGSQQSQGKPPSQQQYQPASQTLQPSQSTPSLLPSISQKNLSSTVVNALANKLKSPANPQSTQSTVKLPTIGNSTQANTNLGATTTRQTPNNQTLNSTIKTPATEQKLPFAVRDGSMKFPSRNGEPEKPASRKKTVSPPKRSRGDSKGKDDPKTPKSRGRTPGEIVPGTRGRTPKTVKFK